MVLTTSDYSRWFDEYERSPVWAKIYSLLAERPVIFMGFSLADHNVSHLVDRLIRWLPQKRVTGFLIDINMPEPRQADLSRYRLKGIQGDISHVLGQIHKEVIRNVLIDTTEKRVDPVRATEISNRIGYAPEWLIDSSGIVLKSIEPLEGHELTGKLILQYKKDDFHSLTDYLKRGSDAELVIPADAVERAVYVLDGEAQLDGTDIPDKHLLVLDRGVRHVLRAKTPVKAMLLGGEPLDGPRHMWWNFVSASKERIEQAKHDWDEGRFGLIPGDDVERIPLPER